MSRIAPVSRQRARDLRAAMTPPERAVWQRLRSMNHALGTHFRRQAPIGDYIADFCDFGRRVVIEIDGDHHGRADQAAHDLRRDAWLTTQGFRVFRYSAAIPADAVADDVFHQLALGAPHPHPLPTGGRGGAPSQAEQPE